jgi:adenylate cyclase
MVAYLLNRYLDSLSEVVLAHGGTIDKFVGDAVVAFWGAPFARADDADRAVQAAMAMYEAGERFRREAPADVPPIGRTRVGLHCGEAIVGNFGGEGRIQYTALGDAMNCAARLEGANKYLHSSALVSQTVVERATLDIFRPMGRIVLSGRSTPLAVYEPVPHLDPDERRTLNVLYERFDRGDLAALEALSACAARHSGDAALRAMVQRLKNAGPGGSYVLESK